MPGAVRLAAATAVLALIASACGGGTSREPEAAAPDPGGGEHRSCVPLAEFSNGDVENAPVQDVEFPWDRSDPVVLEGFDFSRVISGGPPPDGIRPSTSRASTTSRPRTSGSNRRAR
jgi:hypothetical protein